MQFPLAAAAARRPKKKEARRRGKVAKRPNSNSVPNPVFLRSVSNESLNRPSGRGIMAEIKCAQLKIPGVLKEGGGKAAADFNVLEKNNSARLASVLCAPGARPAGHLDPAGEQSCCGAAKRRFGKSAWDGWGGVDCLSKTCNNNKKLRVAAPSRTLNYWL